MKRRVLVTGAAGKTGHALVTALARHPDMVVTGWVRTTAQVPMLERLGARNVLVGDMAEAQMWNSALAAVDVLYLICPNMHPRELDWARTALAVADAYRDLHIIYHSVLHPQTEEMPHHWTKMRVEECLVRSGNPFTIVQPCAYMQNFDALGSEILATRTLRLPYASHTVIDLIHLPDVAEAAVTIASRASDHAYATYQLAPGENLSLQDVADTIEHLIGSPLHVTRWERSAWEADPRNAPLGAYARNTLWAMFEFYERYGFRGNGQVLTWLLGRRPTSFRDYAERLLQDLTA